MGFQFMLILVLLGIYFDAVVVVGVVSLLLFRLPLAILWLTGSKAQGNCLKSACQPWWLQVALPIHKDNLQDHIGQLENYLSSMCFRTSRLGFGRIFLWKMPYKLVKSRNSKCEIEISWRYSCLQIQSEFWGVHSLSAIEPISRRVDSRSQYISDLG